MQFIQRRPAHNPRLRAERLEDRSLPVGNVTGAVVGGVLTLSGDHFANQLQIRITRDGGPTGASEVLVTGQGGTTVGGQSSKSFIGVRHVRVFLRDGDDVLTADPAGDIDLAGSMSINLGGGDNSLSLRPGGRLALGSLAVRAGDGIDAIEIEGGAAPDPRVSGLLSLALGDGETSTSVVGISVLGGIRLSAGDGYDLLALDGVSSVSPSRVRGALTASGGTGQLDVSVIGSELGTVSAAGAGDVTLTLIDSVTRGISATGGLVGLADVNFDGAAIVGGGLVVRGQQARLNVFGGSLTVAGDIAVAGSTAAVLSNQGAIAADKALAVRSGLGDAFVSAGGVRLTVGTNLAISGVNSTDVAFISTGVNEVKGSLTVRGGVAADTFTSMANLKVNRDVSLSFGGGPDSVNVTGALGVPTVGGQLTINTGTGTDAVALTRVTVTGPAVVVTGSGADDVHIQAESRFAQAVTFDLGAGDDALDIATQAGATGPLLFDGRVVARLGTGNDLLALGTAGISNSRVVFGTPGSMFVGGSGLNLFDDELGQFDGTGLLLSAWIDPTTP